MAEADLDPLLSHATFCYPYYAFLYFATLNFATLFCYSLFCYLMLLGKSHKVSAVVYALWHGSHLLGQGPTPTCSPKYYFDDLWYYDTTVNQWRRAQ